MEIFAERNLYDYLNSFKNSVNKHIESESENYILNVNNEEYIKYLVDKYQIENLEIHFDQATVSSVEKLIPAEKYPHDFYVIAGRSYQRDVVIYHIPFTGNGQLLHYLPSTRIIWSHPVQVVGDTILFEIINFRNDPELIKREASSIINSISRQLENVQGEVNGYNKSLEATIRQSINSKKERLLKNNDILSQLGVPIKQKSGVPETFSIPAIAQVKKIVIDRPRASEKEYKPEPTLDETVYNSILTIIQDVGRQFERMPSTYNQKEEEHLRDHFLLYLEPNFVGSATGETFNKTGKTDIMLRYEGKNVFIAECKFWRGEKSYLNTIDQLLGYLTWRDSKSSMIIFVQNKDFTKTLEIAKNVIQQHSCFKQFVNQKDETWFNYLFHLPEDSDRFIKLAVQFFHIPK